MEVPREEILRKAGIPARRFAWYRAAGLVPGPIRIVRMKGRGSRSYYSYDLIDRIERIERLREEGKTIDQIRRLLTGAEEKLGALYAGMFSRGDPVTLAETIPHSELFADLGRKAGLAYPNEFVRSCAVQAERKGKIRTWTVREEVVEAEELEAAAENSKG